MGMRMRDNTLNGTDLGFLVEAALIQVAIGENETILHTHPPASLMVTSNVEVTMPDGSTRAAEAGVELGRSLLHLLGKAITQAVASPDGALALTWADGTITNVLNSWDEYESYTVTHGDQVFIV